MSKPAILDMREYPGVRFNVSTGNTRSESVENTTLEITVGNVTSVHYHTFRKIVDANRSKRSPEKDRKKYHVIGKNTVALVHGYMGHEDSKNTVGNLYEYTVTFYCDEIELLTGANAMRKYLIDQALADANRTEN